MSQGQLKGLKRQLILLLTLCAISVWILLQIDIERKISTVFFKPHYHTGATSKSRFLLDTIGCRIPKLDPFDSSIRAFIFNVKAIDCDLEDTRAKGKPHLVESNLTSLYINNGAFASYNISEGNLTTELSCCYRPFWRVEGNDLNATWSEIDSEFRYGPNCIQFNSDVNIDDEFVKVECTFNTTIIYVDFHAFIPLKEDVEERLNTTEAKDAVSVLVIGIDAVSRLNLYRQMPQTLAFIKENMNVVEMLGYNKVDDNTFPNLVPVLTGYSVGELKNVCWPTSMTVFDACPFVWKNFSSAGHRTMFAEDASWMGTFTWGSKAGFRKQPTDYYPQIFNKVSEDEIGHEKWLNTKLCIGTRLSLDVLLQYATKFALTMLDKLSFGFVWGASLTHDYLNLPKKGDKYYLKFFRKLLNLNVFDKTVLVFMSDHGIRWGDIRGTYQGQLEERLPFLFIAYPDWFKKKYSIAVTNLGRNARRFTTPFDLYETLLDLSDLDRLNKDVIKQRSNYMYTSQTPPRGISLFLPVYENRTCAKAGVAEHWCTCHQSVNISFENEHVKHSADFIVTYINKLLTPFPQCSTVKLDKILKASSEKPTAQMSANATELGAQYYTLTLQTTPGKAMFEATVKYSANNVTYSLAGAISRINLYGKQSNCVSQFRIKLYCYCLNQNRI